MIKKHVRYLIGLVILATQAFSGLGVFANPTFAGMSANLSAGQGGSLRFTSAQTPAPTKKEEPTTVSGKWSFVFDTGGGDEREEAATFEQDGTNVSGKLMNTDVQGTFKDNQLEISFPFTAREGKMSGTLNIKGKLENDSLKGTWDFEKMSGTFTATRVK